MDGTAFGKELLRLRKKAGIPSRELSEKVGKNFSYVSHLEHGKIKKPDYETCFQLFKLLGEEEENIESILSSFGIISFDKEQKSLKLASQQLAVNWDSDWFERMEQGLKNANDRFHNVLNRLIEKDVSRAEVLVTNLTALINTKESFDFLYLLFQYDYSRITPSDREKLLEVIKGFINKGYEFDEYGDFVKKGGS